MTDPDTLLPWLVVVLLVVFIVLFSAMACEIVSDVVRKWRCRRRKR